MAKTEYILSKITELEAQTGIKRTLLAVCPNSISVIRAAFRAAKRNNAPIKFAATLNQVDADGGYTGLTQAEFVRILRQEAKAVNFSGPVIVAIDHGGPWLKDIQSLERWDAKRAMNAVKQSFEAAIAAGFDLIHVDPTVDIFLDKGSDISIELVVARTIELITHAERYRISNNYPPISYEVGTEEVHGGLADDSKFDAFLSGLKEGLIQEGLVDVWPCFIVGKVGTDLHTTTFDGAVAAKLTAKVRSLGSYIKGHYTDNVSNPQDYPLCGMGGANVGPEFTIKEYEGLIELEKIEIEYYSKGQIRQLSNIKRTLWQLVDNSGRWKKWLLEPEIGKPLDELSEERQEWLIKTSCRYIWQKPETQFARDQLYRNLKPLGVDCDSIVLGAIEHSMDKYFYAFNLVNFNDHLEQKSSPW